jgi:carboxyl-terminal processing protease
MIQLSRTSRLLPVALLASAAWLTQPDSMQAQGTAYEQLQAFSAVLSHARLNYVDSVDFSRLVAGAIRGMLATLDPHNHYVTREEFALQQQWDRGELGGPGLTLDEAGSRVTVLSVAPDGPAARGGIQPGDRLLRVNDSSVAGLGSRSIAARLVGDVGTRIRLTLERSGAVPRDTLAVTIKRSKIEHRVVSPPRMADPETGYLRLEEFTPTAPEELSNAIKKIKGAGAKRLLLDLRGNPGGDMEAMAAIASAFLPKNWEIFDTHGRKTSGISPVLTSENGDFAKLPLVLLIDAETASAAEILAGSLQDHDRALVVGRRSFGKGLIQTSLPLPNGDVVWMTTARVVTPSGRVIQRRYSWGRTEDYLEAAGRQGAPEDTLAVYHTDRGRLVRGGGGIQPDVSLSASAPLPVWFSEAIDLGYGAVADSVARQLDGNEMARKDWMSDSTAWNTKLVPLFLARARSELGEQVAPAPAVRSRIARILAGRAAGARWGADAELEFRVRNDPDIGKALREFARIPELLKSAAANQ